MEQIREIISLHAGVEQSSIKLESDLRSDLGISGDDGDELFEDLNEVFNVDWSELDLGVHFGNEGSGPPLPWHLNGNCLMYEVQPCKVSDIVRAVNEGRWHGSERILRSKSARIWMYVWSSFVYLFIPCALFMTYAFLDI